MNLQKLTLQELKALAYDLIAYMEQAKANLRMVNQEISERGAPSPKSKDNGKLKGKKDALQRAQTSEKAHTCEHRS